MHLIQSHVLQISVAVDLVCEVATYYMTPSATVSQSNLCGMIMT